MKNQDLPLAGLRVVEFTHMVMGPAVGAILAELGADVIKVEAIGGDATRRLLGSGAGYFPMYNRGKASICIDLKAPQGVAVAKQLAASADIVVENFRPGAMDRLGLGYDALAALNPRLIFASEKGFLAGPYESRTALDEVAQMAVTGKAAAPMPARVSAWAIYDVFETADDDQVFVGVVTDALWQKFCALFGLDDLWADAALRANNARVLARDTLMPRVRAELKRFSKADLIARLDGSGLPFAPIGRPEDLFDDPHLRAGQGLAPVMLDDGTQTYLPVLPIALDGERLGGGVLPLAGADSDRLLGLLGFDAGAIAGLRAAAVIA